MKTLSVSVLLLCATAAVAAVNTNLSDEAFRESYAEDPIPCLTSKRTVLETLIFSVVGLAVAIIFYIVTTKWFCCGLKTSFLGFFKERCWDQTIKPKIAKCFCQCCLKCCCSCCTDGCCKCCCKRCKDYTVNETSKQGETDKQGKTGKQEKQIESCKYWETVTETGKTGETGELEKQTETSKQEETGEQDKSGEKALCGSDCLVGTSILLHLLAHFVLIIVNIIYLAENTVVSGGSTRSDCENTARIVSFVCVGYETQALIGVPLLFGIWFCLCQRYRREGDGESCSSRCCTDYLELVRFSDVTYAFLAVPFTHTYFLFLGGLWWIPLAIRLVCYAVIFTTAVIAGMRNIVTCFLLIPCCECVCPRDTHGIEIKDCGHLFAIITQKMVPICLKLLTSSSALKTYITIAFNQPSPIRISYLVFSLIRGITSIFTLVFNVFLLRYALLKEENKNEDKWTTRLMVFLDKYEPHVHVVFVIDVIGYGGLIALNAYLVNIEAWNE